MFPRSFRLAFPASLICVVLFCASIQASEPLNEKDSAEIKTLASDFAKELRSAKLSNYTKYLDPASLEKLADEYRHAFSWMTQNHPDHFQKIFKLTPNVPTVMREKDNSKFFSGIELTPEMTTLLSAFGNELNVVAVTGTRDKAYVVMEGRFDGVAGITRPFPSAWLVVHTPQGWKLDGRPIVRSVRRNFDQLKDNFKGERK